MTAEDFIAEILKFSNLEIADHSKRFFKTGKGEYGEGDIFIGVRVPQTRKICRYFKNLPLNEVQKLLDSEIHEHRLAAVIILSEQYAKAERGTKQQIYKMYLKNVAAYKINNWDIVDSSAHKIVGPHLFNEDNKPLYILAASNNIWERRVAVMSTYYFIKNGEYDDTLRLTIELINDKHDLIHKVCGWMLREVGNQPDGYEVLIGFLNKYASEMPRMMLRYSIEKLSEDKRQYYLKMK